MSKCEKTIGKDATCTWLVNLWAKNIYTYATQTIETPITTSLLDRHSTHTVHWNTQTSLPIETPKLPRQLIHPNRPAQGSTQTAQFTEIPWSNPLKDATHLVHWNTLLLHRPLGFYSMKQTISTVYPPPQNPTKTTTTHAKNTTKIEWVPTGLSSRSPTPPPPPHTHTPSPAFLFATSKTFEWHFAGGPMVARHCVLAGIGYVHVLYRNLVALHW